MHTCPALKGHDGAPIIGVDAYKRLMIVGIHRGGVIKNKKCCANVGTLITEELVQILNDQTVKLGA